MKRKSRIATGVLVALALAEVPAAISYSEEGRPRGKIVIDVEPPL